MDDDFAPAPAQRVSDDGGRVIDHGPRARRRAPKKAATAPVEGSDLDPEQNAEELAEKEAKHQLDVLG